MLGSVALGSADRGPARPLPGESQRCAVAVTSGSVVLLRSCARCAPHVHAEGGQDDAEFDRSDPPWLCEGVEFESVEVEAGDVGEEHGGRRRPCPAAGVDHRERQNPQRVPGVDDRCGDEECAEDPVPPGYLARACAVGAVCGFRAEQGRASAIGPRGRQPRCERRRARRSTPTWRRVRSVAVVPPWWTRQVERCGGRRRHHDAPARARTRAPAEGEDLAPPDGQHAPARRTTRGARRTARNAKHAETVGVGGKAFPYDQRTPGI